MADAKKRGWSGRSTRGKSRKGRKKKGEPDFDVQSTAAWTDVTVTAYSVRSAFGVGNRRGGGGGVVDGMDVAGVKDKKGRCVVM